MNRLIVAFSSDTAAHRICAWLAQSGFPARTVCRTGAEVVRAVRYMGGGSVICAARLPDYTADELYDDLDGEYHPCDEAGDKGVRSLQHK